MIRLAQPQSAEEWNDARALIEEYVRSLNVDLSFQEVAEELQHLKNEYGPPSGAFLLAEENGVYLGCVGVRKFSESAAEMKRLYVVPASRGRGVGQGLAENIVSLAKQLGYSELLLDTLPLMKEAQSLYASLGFKPTAAYRFNPIHGTVFLKLAL